MSNLRIDQTRPLQFENREIHEGPRILRRLPEGVEEVPCYSK